MSSDWTEVQILVATADTEQASAIANMAVPYGIYVEDYSDLEQGARDIAHIDLIDEALLQRDRTHSCIHLYLEPQENPLETVSFLRERLAACGIANEVNTTNISEEDWANNWKQYFKPLTVGEKLLICPTWEPVPDSDGRQCLRIDPGMAFGTGGHDTTRMVLEAVEPYITSTAAVLDVGCGSGILSIASLLLGADTAVGVDIDALAVKMARENGEINGFTEPRYRILLGNLVEKIQGQYDIVLANIVADAILTLSPQISAFLRDNGVYIVSGIIEERGDEVESGLVAAGWRIAERRTHGGWCCFICRKG